MFLEKTVSSVRVGGTNRNVVVVGEEALSDEKLTFLAVSLMAIKKSGTLKTSPWGTAF